MKERSIRRAIQSFLVLASLATASMIEVGGNIASDAAWNADTVKVTSNVVVEKGVALTIPAATLVEFQAHYSLQVNGRLQALGNAKDTIRFQAKDTVAGWAGLRFTTDTGAVDSSILAYCRFRSSKATGTGTSGYGGALFANRYSKLSISNCLFLGNSASSGGGLYLQFSHPRIVNCVFRANTAEFFGGGMVSNFSNPMIINTVFDRNTSRTGGGLDFQNSAPNLANVLVTRNTAVTGSALRCATSSPVIKNSIFWGNRIFVSSEGQIVLHDDASDPVFTHNLIEGGKAGLSGDGAGAKYTGTFADNIDENPGFADTTKGDYKLAGNSPSINKGTPDIAGLGLPGVDLNGSPRVVSGRIDLGPYEFQSGSPISRSWVSWARPGHSAWNGLETDILGRAAAIRSVPGFIALPAR